MCNTYISKRTLPVKKRLGPITVHVRNILSKIFRPVRLSFPFKHVVLFFYINPSPNHVASQELYQYCRKKNFIYINVCGFKHFLYFNFKFSILIPDISYTVILINSNELISLAPSLSP